MNKIIRIISAAAAVLIIISLCACSEKREENISASEISSAANSSVKKPTADELRHDIIGNFGRLGEVMHEFYDDGTCVIGGMFGDYEISDDLSLILTTTGGTKTEYVWDDFTSVNYWSLYDGALTVNGNQFSYIEDSDTPTEPERNQ